MIPEFVVTLMLLGAAALHATWNALIKGSTDRTATLLLVMAVSSVPAIVALPFLPLPAAAAWPYLAFSIAIHCLYHLTLIGAYRHGDLSQVYPIARGASPVLVAAGAYVVAGESLGPVEIAGIATVSLGVASLAGVWRPSAKDMKAVGFAILTAIGIALYSVADGMGVRRAGLSFSYIAWLLALDGPIALGAGLYLRRGRVGAVVRRHIAMASIGGIIAALGYGVVIWAMSRLPMAQVSALRETSVIMAALIGTLVLGEPFGRLRIAAAITIVAGNVLLHLA